MTQYFSQVHKNTYGLFDNSNTMAAHLKDKFEKYDKNEYNKVIYNTIR